MHRKAYACGIAYCSSLAHITVCRECEDDMYRVHNGTMVSHFIKRHMGYDVCTMYNNIILDNSCGYMCMYLHVCAVKGGSGADLPWFTSMPVNPPPILPSAILND